MGSLNVLTSVPLHDPSGWYGRLHEWAHQPCPCAHSCSCWGPAHGEWDHRRGRCPSSDEVISDLVWFQWGYCRSYGPWHEDVYHIGDRLRWQPCTDWRVLAWTYFWDGRHEIGGNIGDSAVRHLIVKGGPEFYWERPDQRWQDICGCPVQGAAIEIKDGIIACAWLYLPDELPGEANVYVVRDDGSLQPMPEWNDHPMEVVPPGC